MTTQNLYIQETYINATEGHRIGESDVYETYTDKRGELFLAMQREYGRCVSRVYADEGGEPRAIGWVFQKRCEYEDARADWSDERRYYIREVWVTVHTAPATRSTTYHYA